MSNIFDWINLYSKSYHMTIEKVLALPINTDIKIFFMDRNIIDLSCIPEINPPYEAIKPSIFFRNNYYIIFNKSEEGIRGSWKWNTSNYQEVETDREFDIDTGDYWMPLTNSCYDNKHYTKYHKNTYLGWRGYMMLESDMNKCPDVMYMPKQ